MGARTFDVSALARGSGALPPLRYLGPDQNLGRLMVQSVGPDIALDPALTAVRGCGEMPPSAWDAAWRHGPARG